MTEAHDDTLSEPLIDENDLESDASEKSCKERVADIVYRLVFGVCNSLSSVIVKLLTDFTAVQLTFLQSVGMFIITALILMYQRRSPIPEEDRLKLLARSTAGYLGALLSYVAYKSLPLSDASVIVFSTPVFAALLGRAFIGEACSPFHIGLVLLSLVGVVLAARPPFLFTYGVSGNMLASIAACFSVLFLCVATVLVHTFTNVHSLLIIMYTSALSVAYSAFLCLCFGSFKFPDTSRDQLLMLFHILLSFSCQVFMIKASQLEAAGPASISLSLDVVVVFTFQYMFFDSRPNVLSLCAAALVIISVSLTSLKKLELEDSKLYTKDASA